MLNRIFPKQADNSFRGHWLAIWLMVPVVLLRTLQGVYSILQTHEVAVTADGIPLGAYSPAAADAVVSLFALLGLALLIVSLVCTVILVRYRSLMPFGYVLLLIDVLGSKVLVMIHPIARGGASKVGELSVGAAINYAMLAAIVLGFAMSLVSGRNRKLAP